MTNRLVSLTPKPFSRSRVDIIIPFHGQYDRVSKLVESILVGTRSNPYRITLVDDCSPNSEYYMTMKKVPQVKTIRNREQLGFGGALHAGFQATQQPFVVFMHSDCVVDHQQWLIALGQSLLNLESQNVGIVSARSNNPGPEADPQLRCPKAAMLEAESDIILQEGCLPLYCAMVRRELFSKIGGFIKAYPYGLYEDEELAFRMKFCGYKQGISTKSWVYHEGEATFKPLLMKYPNIRNVMESNYDRCMADIREVLAVH